MTTLDLRNELNDSLDLILDDIDENLYKINQIGFYELFEFVKSIIHNIYDVHDDLIVFKKIQDKLLKDKCENQDLDTLRKIVVDLEKIPLPAQRTPEWFQFRLTRITASDLASVLNLGKYARRFEVLKTKITGIMNYSPNKYTIHGTKYEPIATTAYEIRNKTSVIEFGCLPHPVYTTLGASPDGITPDGIMLEIKCPYSREIKGYPPIYYWTQMQLQLEVADLWCCDFLEISIKEYESREEFIEDTHIDGKLSKTWNLEKGIVIVILQADGKEDYRYVNFNQHIDKQLLEAQNIISELIEENNENHSSFVTKYFYFKKYSCIRIYRDEFWFNSILEEVDEFWSEVDEYKELGIEKHPKYRVKKEKKEFNPVDYQHQKTLDLLDQIYGNKCLLDSDSEDL